MTQLPQRPVAIRYTVVQSNPACVFANVAPVGSPFTSEELKVIRESELPAKLEYREEVQRAQVMSRGVLRIISTGKGTREAFFRAVETVLRYHLTIQYIERPQPEEEE